MSLWADSRRVMQQGKRFWLLLPAILPLIYVLSGFYSIGAEQRGILTRFGKVVDDKVPPGMHYHLPWPMEDATKIRTTAVRSMELDFAQSADKNLQPELTTGDENLVHVAFNLQYTIAEPGLFSYQAADPEPLLQQLAYAESIRYVAAQKIDDLLTTGRNRFQISLKQAIQQQAQTLKLGVNITSVQIRRLEPPTPVKATFDDVAAARSEKQKLIQYEQGERSSRLAKARSEANQQQQQAQAYASEALEQAKGDHERIMTTWQEYRKAPELMGQRLYLEMLEEILPKATLKIVNTPQADADIPASSR